MTNQREELLRIVVEHSKQKHEKRSEELHGKHRTAELILISWAFIFSGIAGLYQAELLLRENIQQAVVLLVLMTLSIFICIKEVMMQQKQNDVPNLQELWQLYVEAVNASNSGIDNRIIVLNEQVAQAYILAEELNREKLALASRRLSYAAILIALALILIILFISFPNAHFTFKSQGD